MLTNLPAEKDDKSEISMDELALIDEISGLTPFIDNFLTTHDIPEQTRSRIESRLFRYSGAKPKSIAMLELREALYGRR